MFLRTLASYRIPAVIERRRKELLDRLCLLQGDTLKDVPPVIEPVEEKPPTEEKVANKAPAEEKVTLREKKLPAGKERSTSESSTKDGQERGESPASTSSITSPSHGGRLVKRDSKVVNRVKDYEAIHFSAKKEEVDQTPKRWVTLKKVAKPVDYRHSSSSPPPEDEKEEKEEKVEEKEEKKEDKAEDKTEATKRDSTDSPGHDKDTLEVRPSRERASSVGSTEEGPDEGEESEKGGDKKKKKSKLAFGFKGKKKRDKSPAPERKDKSPAPERKAEPAAEEDAEQPKEGEEEEEEMQLAEGVKICGVLERKKKGIGHKKVKIDAKVFHTSLVLGGKEELDLANCSLEETASGFDLTHPQHRSALVFKVDGPEDEKQRWVTVMKEAIAEATPAKEEEGMEERGRISQVLSNLIKVLLQNSIRVGVIVSLAAPKGGRGLCSPAPGRRGWGGGGGGGGGANFVSFRSECVQKLLVCNRNNYYSRTDEQRLQNVCKREAPLWCRWLTDSGRCVYYMQRTIRSSFFFNTIFTLLLQTFCKIQYSSSCICVNQSNLVDPQMS